MKFSPLPQAFHTGECFDAYQLLGSRPVRQGRLTGWQFRVWAPGAVLVQVEGDFSGWQGIPLQKDSAGVWSGFVPDAQEGQLYKYNIHGADGSWQEHADPYAFGAEVRPGMASRLVDLEALSSVWTDEAWLRRREKNYDQPMSIYELHAGSWKRHKDGSWYGYEQLADELVPWLVGHGFTHVELLPLAEHPFDGSWGYQTTGYFAPTARYGSPLQFARFVNTLHNAGLGVLMDFVPVHFAVNRDGLARFDGSFLYEYDSDVGTSEWGSCNFNFYRGEVCSFLQSAAALWLDLYHCDGLRMDAISRALYWQGDGGRGVNAGAVQFLRRMNQGLHHRWPSAILVAEDSTSYLKVTAPVSYDGLGFDYKWDMGWMHDTLNYFSTPFDQRPAQYSQLLLSMDYFYHELYLLALSHDEVVHGKKTVIDKLWGSYEEKFSQARLLYFYMLAHPGKKLNFMGSELAHFREWDEGRGLDWLLLDFPLHQSFQSYWAALGRLYRSLPALYSGEYHPGRFRWLVRSDPARGVYAWERIGPDGETVVAVMNTREQSWPGYSLPLGRWCQARILMNSQWQCWGGRVPQWEGPLDSGPEGALCLELPALGGVLLLLEQG